MADQDGPATSEPSGTSVRRSQGFVDYDNLAGLYREGRTLPDLVLDVWGRAVRPHLPPVSNRIHVVDLGAGTGVFATAWPLWTPADVTAVEPSAAMIVAADVQDPAVTFIQGVAEALPLRSSSADVVWISTAFHHFADLGQATTEVARVLRGGGRVLIRTYVPGRTEVTYADEFPGRSRWQARFQTADQLIAILRGHGFRLIDVREVLEWEETYADSERWALKMRHADSMFTALSDEEFAEGIEALRAQPSKVGRLELTLLVFERM